MSRNRSILKFARKQLKGRISLTRVDAGETVFIEPAIEHIQSCARNLVAKVCGKSTLTEAHWLHQFDNGHIEVFLLDLHKVVLSEAKQTSPTPGVRITMYWSEIWTWDDRAGALIEKVGHIAVQRFLQVDHQGRFRFPPDWSIFEIKYKNEYLFRISTLVGCP